MPAFSYLWVVVVETPVDGALPSPQSMVMPEPVTGSVMVWLVVVVFQVVMKARSVTDTPETVTVTILQLLPSSKTLPSEAVTLTLCRPLRSGSALKASVEDPWTISKSSELPPVPIP